MTATHRTGHDSIVEAAVDLVDAEILAFGVIGFGGPLPDGAVAYRILSGLLREQPEQVRPWLDELLAGGSPAGRAYAATLLGQVDPVAAEQAWRAMADDPSPLLNGGGCRTGETTLGAYALRQLPDPRPAA